jgi:hypothetical protein
MNEHYIINKNQPEKRNTMSPNSKVNKKKNRANRCIDPESPGKIKKSDPYFSKDTLFYEEMEWFLSGNFTSVRKIIRKTKTGKHDLQPC